MNHHILVLIALICVSAIISQLLAWRLRIPSIVLLLGAGVLVGPVTGWLNPDEIFGDLLLPFVSIAVAIILFEGSLTLEFEEIRKHGRVVTNLISSGALVTWLLTTVITHWVVGFEWPLAFLFGSIMVVTGPTVVVPMLRTVRPNAEVASILRWEGILIDPLGAILALLTFNAVIASQFSAAVGGTVLVVFKTVLIGTAIGSIAGYGLGQCLKRYWIPDYLQNPIVLFGVIAVFVGADVAQSETGFLAVTVMGLWLANMKDVHIEDVLRFKESLSILLISSLFVVLASRLDLSQLSAMGMSAFILFLLMQFVVRPLNILVATRDSVLSWRNKALLGWIAPRGIVAAAVSAAFAIRLEEQGFEQASLLVPLTFAIIIGTVLWQSATAGLLARVLGVSEPPPNGVLMIGANLVARNVAKALFDAGFTVLVADNQWRHIRQARMLGLATYFGNPMSEHAATHMSLSGVGKMLALSRRPDFNSLACSHFRHELGRDSIFSLPVSLDSELEKRGAGMAHRGRDLFDKEASTADMRKAFHSGAEIKVTTLTEDFDFEAYQKQNHDRYLPLFTWNEKKVLLPFTAGEPPQPKPGWTVMSLVTPSDAASTAGAMPAETGQ